jgi:hypothetical protein
MAYVTDLPLNTVWIMDPTNPADFVACGSSASIGGGAGGRVKDLQLPGEFREYAGGDTGWCCARGWWSSTSWP